MWVGVHKSHSRKGFPRRRSPPPLPVCFALSLCLPLSPRAEAQTYAQITWLKHDQRELGILSKSGTVTVCQEDYFLRRPSPGPFFHFKLTLFELSGRCHGCWKRPRGRNARVARSECISGLKLSRERVPFNPLMIASRTLHTLAVVSCRRGNVVQVCAVRSRLTPTHFG